MIDMKLKVPKHELKHKRLGAPMHVIWIACANPDLMEEEISKEVC
jgi:hypothetical protein